MHVNNGDTAPEARCPRRLQVQKRILYRSVVSGDEEEAYDTFQ